MVSAEVRRHQCRQGWEVHDKLVSSPTWRCHAPRDFYADAARIDFQGRGVLRVAARIQSALVLRQFGRRGQSSAGSGGVRVVPRAVQPGEYVTRVSAVCSKTPHRPHALTARHVMYCS